MAVYQSRFATRGVTPSTGARFRWLKRAAAVGALAAVAAAAVFGLWRATAGMPEPVELPGVVTSVR
ncbi:hypothetical protein LX16_5272 [Stackebrandtia albiflava]|uniref:Uncharacterized protein n=2 Tax=Stackebrandtia albiflava TaxID=406432 RepID=A0A562UL11_9ACTN|nr:hypothetical protein LX16_5272 [Stackebrandtia albiflava]